MKHADLSIIAIITVERLHLSHPLYTSQYLMEYRIKINATNIPRQVELLYLRHVFTTEFIEFNILTKIKIH